MKQPDRFTRAVDKFDRRDEWCTPVIDASKAITLLRKEHVWMRRQLKDLSKIQLGSAEYQNGLEIAVQEMVYRLNQRRK